MRLLGSNIERLNARSSPGASSYLALMTLVVIIVAGVAANCSRRAFDDLGMRCGGRGDGHDRTERRSRRPVVGSSASS
jgi:hypothetical protein